MQHPFRVRVRVGSDTGGITSRRIAIRSRHAHEAPRHLTGLRERYSALRRRQFDSDSAGPEMTTSGSTCWMIEQAEPDKEEPAARSASLCKKMLARPRRFELLTYSFGFGRYI